MTHITDYYHN